MHRCLSFLIFFIIGVLFYLALTSSCGCTAMERGAQMASDGFTGAATAAAATSDWKTAGISAGAGILLAGVAALLHRWNKNRKATK